MCESFHPCQEQWRASFEQFRIWRTMDWERVRPKELGCWGARSAGIRNSRGINGSEFLMTVGVFPLTTSPHCRDEQEK